ncbi:MAG: hypothetical protein COT61_04600, partial [Candidatus Portnoybacteria bacterium CG09_land_8_20_14_0_10_44_13]
KKMEGKFFGFACPPLEGASLKAKAEAEIKKIKEVESCRCPNPPNAGNALLPFYQSGILCIILHENAINGILFIGKIPFN